MTFYEAALRVLQSAGHPLHVGEITERSIKENLLSHVGKTPEQTMLSRLAAMAKRPRDRRVIVTAKDTFALSDWQLPEDPAALAQTGVLEPHPEEELPPLRPVERHPEPRGDNVRSAGRGEKRRRDEEERGRRRRFPPISEVVFEVLSEAGEGLRPEEIAERARRRELASDELSNEQILTALLEDNQRRIDVGRRPQFLLDKENGRISLERAGQPSEAPPLELQAAFAAALGIPLEGGRPVLPRREERLADGGYPEKLSAAKAAVKEARRAMASALRRRLADLDGGTFEKSVVRVMQALSFREIKVAKRTKDGPLLTARRKEGSVELRYAVRTHKGAGAVDRRMVQELRRDLGHYSAQLGLLCCPGDVRGDAKSEAVGGGSLVFLWCGDALGEKFLEAGCGVSRQEVALFEMDERFFEQARIDAEEARARREERHREREQGRLETAGGAPMSPEGAPTAPAPVEEEGAGGEEGEEGDEDLEAASAFVNERAPHTGEGALQPGGRRRRRRRRGRRGRRPLEGGVPGQAEPVAAPMEGGAAPPASPPEPTE
ncbi:MAG: HTH domain-containing protein [Myxococcota bacterium]